MFLQNYAGVPTHRKRLGCAEPVETESATQIQTCVTKGVALAGRKFAIVCHLYTGECSMAGEAVSKTACGGFDSQPSVPEAG